MSLASFASYLSLVYFRMPVCSWSSLLELGHNQYMITYVHSISVYISLQWKHYLHISVGIPNAAPHNCKWAQHPCTVLYNGYMYRCGQEPCGACHLRVYRDDVLFSTDSNGYRTQRSDMLGVIFRPGRINLHDRCYFLSPIRTLALITLIQT